MNQNLKIKTMDIKDKWLIGDGKGGYYNIDIPDSVIKNPKSFYNSKKGKKHRILSNKIYKELCKKN